MLDYLNYETLLELIELALSDADEVIVDDVMDETYETIADDMIDEVYAVGDVTGIFDYDDTKEIAKRLVGILEEDIDIKLIELCDPEINGYEDLYFIDLIEKEDETIELWVEPVYFEDGKIKNFEALSVFAFLDDLDEEVLEANLYEDAEYTTYTFEDLDEE